MMYSRIMVPLDGSELAECVLPHVEALADVAKPPNVVLVRIVEPYLIPGEDDVNGSFTAADLTDKAEQSVSQQHLIKAADYLKGIAANLKVKSEVDRVVPKGKPAEALIDYAVANNVDLVIISTHGRSGISRWARGSVAERILHSTRVPVFMIRAPGGALVH